MKRLHPKQRTIMVSFQNYDEEKIWQEEIPLHGEGSDKDMQESVLSWTRKKNRAGEWPTVYIYFPMW